MRETIKSKPSDLRVHPNSDIDDIDYSTHDSPLDDLNDDLLFDTKHEENITSMKLTPTTNQKPPPGQTMERPLGSAYKIPSRVFVRTKSTPPVEWSVASNESLFSIHAGDSSIERESIFYYNTSNVADKGSESKEEEEDDVETVKRDKNLSLTPSVSSHSNHSDISAGRDHSFVFPILTGKNGKDGSARIDESVRIGFDHSSRRLTPTSPKKSPLPQPQQKPEESKASTPTRSSWFGCFTCCTN